VTGYVVDIKPSARRVNGAVGDTVNRRGTRRRFEAREDAEAWAAGLSARGDRRVWIRAANPADSTGADAYLVGRRRRREDRTESASRPESGSEAAADGGRQSELAD
jgi:hypothetical protein